MSTPAIEKITIERDPRWAGILARDRSLDGNFYYSVATTGIYCRPSCPSWTANPKNVRFHDSIADAEAHGFPGSRVDQEAGISAMNLINAVILKSLFMPFFLGTNREPEKDQDLRVLIAIRIEFRIEGMQTSRAGHRNVSTSGFRYSGASELGPSRATARRPLGLQRVGLVTLPE